MIALKGMALSMIVASTLVGWLGWPPAEPVPIVVDLVGPCSRATTQWADRWRRPPPREAPVVRAAVLCRTDGNTYAATIVYSPSARGPRAVSWHPVTTFFGTLPAHATERLDIFDQNGELVEYALVERPAGRIDFYSVSSRRIGSGRMDSSLGRVERFSADGRLAEPRFVPITPDADDGVTD